MQRIREAIYEGVPMRQRRPIVAEEMLASICLTPLLVIDFRLEVSDLVSCSDASEQGGGVCVARSLSATGQEMLLRQLQPLQNLGAGQLVLVESYAGIGGARVALDILGIRPRLYVAIESADDKRSITVLSRAQTASVASPLC